ncbi:MAG: hypothetical protein KHY46_13105 [Clostridiales bacterium]|nr:hypothetical protein [Clostridiales bacterium]
MANENTIQATGTFITRKGLNLITKLVAAKGTLSFSRAAVGTGKPPEGYSPDSMISLSSYKMDAEISDYGTQEDKAYVTMQVSSDQVEEGFLLTEVGLYATDPDEGEILYAYMDISTDPTYIYANGSANRTKYAEFTLYVLVGTVEKVTAAVTPGSIITKETFKASNMPVTDTHGILGDSGSTVMSQELFDAVAEKIVNELVSNEKLNTVLAEKLADYIMKSKIVNHLLATDESTVLSGPMGKELKRLLDVLNTKQNQMNNNIDNREAVADLFEVANVGLNSRRIVQCNGSTLNTPFKAGLVGDLEGTAYVNMSNKLYGTVLYIASGSSRVFLANKANGNWSTWSKLISNVDFDSRIDIDDTTTIAKLSAQIKTRFQRVYLKGLNLKPSYGTGVVLEIKNTSGLSSIRMIIWDDDSPNIGMYCGIRLSLSTLIKDVSYFSLQVNQ